MTVFKNFERQVVEILVKPHIPLDQLKTVLDDTESVSFEDYASAGYFITVHHPSLPSSRIVCDKPLVIGKFKDVQCGFVVFLENGELTLECHSWGLMDIPINFRENAVEIEVIH